MEYVLQSGVATLILSKGFEYFAWAPQEEDVHAYIFVTHLLV